MKVALSVSLCIKDIIRGKVNENEVSFISAGTYCPYPNDWEDVINGYRLWYWFDNPDEGESILRRFINAGKVLQPRLEGKSPVQAAGKIWCELEEYNSLAHNIAGMRDGDLASNQILTRRRHKVED